MNTYVYIYEMVYRFSACCETKVMLQIGSWLVKRAKAGDRWAIYVYGCDGLDVWSCTVY